MKSKKTFLLITIGLMLLIVQKSYSQESNCYKKYTFEEFLRLKTKNDYEYVRTIYKKLIYPYPEKDFIDEGVEGVVKVILINNGKDDFEIIPVEKVNNFHKDVIHAITLINSQFLNVDNEKYMTEFSIKLDFEPHEKRNIKNYNVIHLFGHKSKKKEKVMN